ncbi:MAG: XrtA system polysaccharide deacetylase [Vicinamibacterales bacterium]
MMASHTPGTPAIVNAMTIDVEEHFHANVFDGTPVRDIQHTLASRVVASTRRMLDLLDAAGVKATCFVLGAVADQHPSLVLEIAARGHEIASHGYAHQLVYTQSREAFRDDVRRAKQTLEALAGTNVRGYRAPSYSVTERSLWALDVLAEEGYAYDASIFPIRHDRYGIPHAPRHAYVLEQAAGRLVEAPPSTIRMGGVNFPVAGGGYFRLLPYAWTRFGIGRLNASEQRPAIFYTHPWEIDPEQPRLPLPRLHAMRHYANLDTTEAKFVRLLQEFRFAPLSQILAADGKLDPTVALPMASSGLTPGVPTHVM